MMDVINNFPMGVGHNTINEALLRNELMRSYQPGQEPLAEEDTRRMQIIGEEIPWKFLACDLEGTFQSTNSIPQEVS